MVDTMHYSQSVTEGNKKNFDSQEARLVMSSVKKELDGLKALIAKNPGKDGWEKNSLDDAIKIVDTQGFYKLEANNKVTYNLDKVASYLSIIYNRILKPGGPKKYIDQKNEKIFQGTILAAQIALEAINCNNPKGKRYDVGVVNGKLNPQTETALKKFQKDFLGASEADGKPGKKTIGKLLGVLNAQLVNNGETPVTGQKKDQPAAQKKPEVTQKKPETQTGKVERLNGKTEIVREGDISYYVVQPGDTTKIIRNRLAQTQEFSYLQEKQYAPMSGGRSYLGFNIRDKNLKPGNKVPIPIETEKRQISDKEFYNKSKSAIDKILSGKNSDYADKVRKLVSTAGKDGLALVMTAFAKKETTNNPNDLIGTGQLYRYENATRYSISHFHILMEGSGKRARDNLGFKDADCYDPVNAGMLFLGYWCETKSNLDNYLNPKRSGWAYRAADVYNHNVRNTYSKSLQNHYNHAKKQVA